MQPAPIGHYYEDFTVGEVIQHELSKTIFESDNNFFSLLTMNNHPVHTNIDYAAKNQHGKVLVVGTLVFSLAVGITVPDISGKAIANLGYEDVPSMFVLLFLISVNPSLRQIVESYMLSQQHTIRKGRMCYLSVVMF